MRIIDTNGLGNCAPSQTGRTSAAQSPQTASKSSASSTGSGNSDRTELTGGSHQIAAALTADASARAQRVQQIAAAVQSGTYEPDSAAVSRAMVSEALGEK